MEYNSLDFLLNHPLPSNHKTPENKPGTLETLLEGKLHCLSDILKKIEQETQKRNDLSQHSIDLIYEHYCALKSQLLGLSFWELGSNSSIDSRRSSLGKQLDVLKQEVRQEQIQCWQDISRLNKEFRNWFKQYRDLMQRVRLVTGHDPGTRAHQPFHRR